MLAYQISGQLGSWIDDWTGAARREGFPFRAAKASCEANGWKYQPPSPMGIPPGPTCINPSGSAFSAITGTVRDLATGLISPIKDLVCSDYGQKATTMYATSQGVPPQATTAAQSKVCGGGGGMIATPAPAPKATATKGITTFDKGLWRRAVPTGLSAAAGLGGGFGEPYREVAPATARQGADTLVDVKTFEKQTGTRPWYRKPLVWAAIAGGAAAIGGGAYLVMRK